LYDSAAAAAITHQVKGVRLEDCQLHCPFQAAILGALRIIMRGYNRGKEVTSMCSVMSQMPLLWIETP
jgi:hypothetical protein